MTDTGYARGSLFSTDVACSALVFTVTVCLMFGATAFIKNRLSQEHHMMALCGESLSLCEDVLSMQSQITRYDGVLDADRLSELKHLGDDDAADALGIRGYAFRIDVASFDGSFYFEKHVGDVERYSCSCQRVAYVGDKPATFVFSMSKNMSVKGVLF